MEFEKFAEYGRWIAPLKKDTIPSYQYTMRLYTEFSKLNPKQLIDDAEKDMARPARERGGPTRKLIEFFNYLVSEYKPIRGRKAENGITGLSPYKARGMVGILRSFYSRNGFPITELPLPAVAPRKENARVEFSIQDVRRMAEAAPTKRDRALILVGLQGAFDANTVIKLNLADLPDKDLGKLLNNEMPDTPILLHVVREKEGIDYHTCLGYDSVDALRAYLQERKARGEELTLESPMFVLERGEVEKDEKGAVVKRSWGRIDKSSVFRLMREVVVKAGVISRERLKLADFNVAGYHALRATFSRRMEYAGLPVAYIDYMQGHQLPHGGAYRKPTPRALLDKYKEFEEAVSISQAPASVTEIEKKLGRELEKERAYTRSLEGRIGELEKKSKIEIDAAKLEALLKVLEEDPRIKKAIREMEGEGTPKR